MGFDNLQDLWVHVNRINRKHFPENELIPIVGGGKARRPKAMFVFINPTMRNSSSDKGWNGPRFPFIGTKQVWNVFYKAGLFDRKLIDCINDSAAWSIGLADRVLDFLNDRGFYMTNIVKWTGHDSTLPEAEKIGLFLPILRNEIEIVNPQRIIAFGLMPFENMTGMKIRLSDYYENSVKKGKLVPYPIDLHGNAFDVFPCYFPVGRGDPKRAVEMLKLLKPDLHM